MNNSLFARYCSMAFLFFVTSLFAQANLLQDPDFENGGYPWLLSEGIDRTIVTTGAEHGASCQRVILRSSGTRRVFQDIDISANTAKGSYYVSGYVRTSGADGGGAGIVVFWILDAIPPNSIDSAHIARADTLGLLTGTTAWIQQSATKVAPAGAVWARIFLLGKVEPDNSGTVWFDDMSFSLSTQVGITENARLSASPGLHLTVTPNTRFGSIMITADKPMHKMRVYDLSGKLIAKSSFSNSTHFVWKVPANLSNGTYMLTAFTTDNRTIARQFFLNR